MSVPAGVRRRTLNTSSRPPDRTIRAAAATKAAATPFRCLQLTLHSAHTTAPISKAPRFLYAAQGHNLQPNPFLSTERKHHARLFFASGATHARSPRVDTPRFFVHWVEHGLRQHYHEGVYCCLVSYHDYAAPLKAHFNLTPRQAFPGISYHWSSSALLSDLH